MPNREDLIKTLKRLPEEDRRYVIGIYNQFEGKGIPNLIEGIFVLTAAEGGPLYNAAQKVKIIEESLKD